jgi:hypothetical protein
MTVAQKGVRASLGTYRSAFQHIEPRARPLVAQEGVPPMIGGVGRPPHPTADGGCVAATELPSALVLMTAVKLPAQRRVAVGRLTGR